MTTNQKTFVFATGNWRKAENKEKFSSVKAKLDGLGHFHTDLLSQEDEGYGQALSAHKLMKNAGYFDKSTSDKLVLFMGAGRGSSQFTVLNMKGDIVKGYMNTGYPKDGPGPIDELRYSLSQVCKNHTISMIVAFDSFYHICKGNCPVIPDKGILPKEVETTGSNFANTIQILPESWDKTPMIVVRNFNVDGMDGLCKINHLTSFEKGDPVFDLGSGRVALVDPSNGTALYEAELPKDWMDNDASLDKIVDLIDTGRSRYLSQQQP